MSAFHKWDFFCSESYFYFPTTLSISKDSFIHSTYDLGFIFLSFKIKVLLNLKSSLRSSGYILAQHSPVTRSPFLLRLPSFVGTLPPRGFILFGSDAGGSHYPSLYLQDRQLGSWVYNQITHYSSTWERENVVVPDINLTPKVYRIGVLMPFFPP